METLTIVTPKKIPRNQQRSNAIFTIFTAEFSTVNSLVQFLFSSSIPLFAFYHNASAHDIYMGFAILHGHCLLDI